MSDLHRAHRLMFKRFSATRFEKAFAKIKSDVQLKFGPDVTRQLSEGLYKAQFNVLVFAIDADLALFRRQEAGSPAHDNILYHELGKSKLTELHKILGDPVAIQNFVPDGDLDSDSQRAYTFYCERILGEGWRIPHLWSESGRYKDFQSRNPMAAMLLQKVFENFIGNVRECLERVKEDLTALQTCFLDGRPISRITKVISTGSDSQRGGKQVLFLDFETSDKAVTRVVYKPSDIEIDYLLVGRNSESFRNFLAAHNDDPGYPRPGQSLFELINETLGQETIDSPEASRDLSTYVVLPRYPGSGFSPQDTRPPIRDSYGYLEFLSFKPEPTRPPSGTADSLIDMFTTNPDLGRPGGEPDWIVYDENEVAACMRNWGRISMLACLLLIRDLHHENRRLRRGNPTLIDLEMTGTGTLRTVSETDLFRSIRNSAHSSRGEQVISFTDGITGPISYESGAGILTWSHDQIYFSEQENGHTTHCALDSPNALEDIKLGMFDVLENLSSGTLKSWIKQVNAGQVIVRYLSLEPYAELVENSFKALLQIHTLNSTAETAMRDYWDETLEKHRRNAIKLWMEVDYRPEKPAFFFTTPDGIGKDLMNLDLPRFYRRINSKTLLSSAGVPLGFNREFFDIDVLFPDVNEPIGYVSPDLSPQKRAQIIADERAELKDKLQFNRFLETTGLDDISAVIDKRLDLDDKSNNNLVQSDIAGLASLREMFTFDTTRR